MLRERLLKIETRKPLHMQKTRSTKSPGLPCAINTTSVQIYLCCSFLSQLERKTIIKKIEVKADVVYIYLDKVNGNDSIRLGMRARD